MRVIGQGVEKEIGQPVAGEMLRGRQPRREHETVWIDAPRAGFAANPPVLPHVLPVYRHYGLYAYRVPFLRAFPSLPVATIESFEALEQLRLIMSSATKRVRTSSGLSEQPDWPTRLKAGRLLMAMAAATVAELGAQPNRRTLRIAP